jgi:hypothetical protein
LAANVLVRPEKQHICTFLYKFGAQTPSQQALEV